MPSADDLYGEVQEVSPREIPRQQAPENDQRVVFSFKYLHTQNPKFKPDDCPSDFFRDLLSVLQQYSQRTADEFTDQNNPDHRHII